MLMLPYPSHTWQAIASRELAAAVEEEALETLNLLVSIMDDRPALGPASDSRDTW